MEWEEVYHQKQVKNYLQNSVIELFNKKPVKGVEKMCKLFHDKITAKEIAVFIKNNLDYDSKLRKPRPTITKIMVGQFFGQQI